MSAGDESLPEWAKILAEGPIEIDHSTTPQELARKLKPRLEALLRWYLCGEAGLGGWRLLALRLALEHSIAGARVMQIATPMNHLPGKGGRPRDANQELWIAHMRAASGQGASDVEAAKLVRRTFKQLNPPSERRLRNLLAEARRSGRQIFPWVPFERTITDALMIAATELERDHEN